MKRLLTGVAPLLGVGPARANHLVRVLTTHPQAVAVPVLQRELSALANKRLAAVVKESRTRFPKRTLTIKFAGPFTYVTIDHLTVEFYDHDRYDHEKWKMTGDAFRKVPMVRVESPKFPHAHRDAEVEESTLYFLWRAVEDVKDITNSNTEAVADDLVSAPAGGA